MSDVVQGTAKITKTKTKSGSVVEESLQQEVVTEGKFTKPPCTVGVSVGFTRNMGNYESMRFSVSLNVPCDIEEVDEVYSGVKDWVEEKVNTINDEFDNGGA